MSAGIRVEVSEDDDTTTCVLCLDDIQPGKPWLFVCAADAPINEAEGECVCLRCARTVWETAKKEAT